MNHRDFALDHLFVPLTPTLPDRSPPASAIALDGAAPIHFDTRWFGDHGIGRFAAELFARLPDTRPLRIGVPKLSAADPVASTWAASRLASGTWFSPGFNAPLRSAVPVVFTIHDLIHLKVAGESSWLRRMYYESVVRPAARRAACILTVSDYSRREIVDWTGVDPARVQVVGNGVAAAFGPDGPRHDAGRPYFLHVGRRASHKNIARLVAAFAQARARHDALLLFTGSPDEPTQRLLQERGLADQARFTGRVDDAALAALYRGASALVFPSLYEGFGLPIVEAMACGTPVITADATSTAEVAGPDTALLVAPTDVDQLATAMDRLLEEPALAVRLARCGLVRARDFRWEEVARRTAAALRNHVALQVRP